MKQMTCAQMGGPSTCEHVITGSNAVEMVNTGMGHVKEAHPEMAEQISKMTPEETTKWMTEFTAKFNSTQEA